MAHNWHQSGPFSVHLVKEHYCCPNFLAQPIRREEKFGPTSKFAIYEQKCKHSKRTNRQISLALYRARVRAFYLWARAYRSVDAPVPKPVLTGSNKPIDLRLHKVIAYLCIVLQRLLIMSNGTTIICSATTNIDRQLPSFELVNSDVEIVVVIIICMPRGNIIFHPGP
jgi:hypothetical protein